MTNEVAYTKDKSIASAQRQLQSLDKAGGFYSSAELKVAMADLIVLSQRDASIKNCSASSIVKVLLMSVKSGLSLITTPPQAHAVVYKDKSGYSNLQFIPEYRGLLKLIYENSDILKIDAHMVLENDHIALKGDSFEYEVKEFNRLNTKNYKGVLLICNWKNGDKTWHFTGADEIEQVKATAKTKMIWDKWFNEMAIKTAIKKLSKTIQIHNSKLAQAVEWDSWEQVGKTEMTEDGQMIQKSRKQVKAKTDGIKTIDTVEQAKELVGDDDYDWSDVEEKHNNEVEEKLNE